MTDGVFALIVVLYLAAGWYIADIIDVDTEDALLDAFIVLFWPLVVVLGLFVFIFWS